MVAVVALRDQWFALVNSQQTKSGAIVPAARALAEIATDRSGAANLRAVDALRRLHQGGIVLLHFSAFDQLFQRNACSQTQAGILAKGNPLKFAQVLQAYEALG